MDFIIASETDYVLGGLVIVAMLWAFIRVTVRDPGPRAHGSPGGHAGYGDGSGGGGDGGGGDGGGCGGA